MDQKRFFVRRGDEEDQMEGRSYRTAELFRRLLPDSDDMQNEQWLHLQFRPGDKVRTMNNGDVWGCLNADQDADDLRVDDHGVVGRTVQSRLEELTWHDAKIVTTYSSRNLYEVQLLDEAGNPDGESDKDVPGLAIRKRGDGLPEVAAASVLDVVAGAPPPLQAAAPAATAAAPAASAVSPAVAITNQNGKRPHRKQVGSEASIPAADVVRGPGPGAQQVSKSLLVEQARAEGMDDGDEQQEQRQEQQEQQELRGQGARRQQQQQQQQEQEQRREQDGHSALHASGGLEPDTPIKTEPDVKSEYLERLLPVEDMEVEQLVDFFNSQLKLSQYVNAIQEQNVDGETLLELLRQTENLEAFIETASTRDGKQIGKPEQTVHQSRNRAGVKKHEKASRKRSGNGGGERRSKRASTVGTSECRTPTIDLTQD
jgi:hypothetical protein